MIDALRLIQKKYCTVCQLGAPSKLIGYQSSGTCLDYIFDNFNVPYAFAWEIYTNETPFPLLQNPRPPIKNAKPPIKNAKPRMQNVSPTIQNAISIDSSGIHVDTLEKKQNYVNNQQTRASFFLMSEEEKLIESSFGGFTRTYTETENDYCARLFNPLDKSSYDIIVNNWTNALYEVINHIRKK